MKTRVLHSQLRAASEIWSEIRSTPHPADRWLARYFHENRKRFGSRDRRFISETIYALFRQKRFIETWAESLKVQDHPYRIALLAAVTADLVSLEQFQQEWLANPKRIHLPAQGFYQRLRHQELPEGCRFPSEDEELAVKYSFPEWLVRRWIRQFGKEKTEALLSAMQSRPPLTLRVNPLKTTRDKLMMRFGKKGIQTAATQNSPYGIVLKDRLNIWDSEEFREGFFEVQDEGSQKVTQLVNPKPCDIVWDVCAGGGGKTLFLAALMKNQGRVLATDIRRNKLEELKKRAKRAGVYNIFPAAMEHVAAIREVRKKGIDKIVIDAPCSGTGTLRRNPDAKWKLAEDDFKRFHQEQVAIIEKSLPLLKKGGRFYYITCSLEREENEAVMEEIFSKYPQLKKVPVPQNRGEVETRKGQPVPYSTQEGYLRLYPDTDQTDGFFLAIAENK